MGSLILAFQQTSNSIMVTFVILFVILALFLLHFLFRFGWIYIQATVSGAHVSLLRLVAMRFRRINVEKVVAVYIVAQKAGLDLRIEDLEIHYMAGGNVFNVVNALIVAKAAGADFTYDHACAIDLAGRDVAEAAKSWAIPTVFPCPSPESGLETINAIAQDGIEVKVKLRVMARICLERLVGGAGEEILIQRIGEEVVRKITDMSSHREVIQCPSKLVEHLMEQNFDAGTRWELVRMEVAEISRGEGVGARLQAEPMERDQLGGSMRKDFYTD